MSDLISVRVETTVAHDPANVPHVGLMLSPPSALVMMSPEEATALAERLLELADRVRHARDPMS